MRTSPQESLVQSLRERLLGGHYAPDQKLTEQRLAEGLGVSRTLIRLALAELEHEGLVMREPNRGFRVRVFTLEEVADAIAVRGELEAMAARLLAERGLTSDDKNELANRLHCMDELLLHELDSVENRARWIELNGQFHSQLIALSGNTALAAAIDDLGKIPLVSARAIVFDAADATRSLDLIRIAHRDHRSVFEAIVARQGSRAAAIMREHAERSRTNKQSSFASMQRREPVPAIPGLKLVSA